MMDQLELKQFTTFEFPMQDFLKKYIQKIVKIVQSRTTVSFGGLKSSVVSVSSP